MSETVMDCQVCRDHLDDYRRNALPGDVRQQVREHLEGCGECAAQLRSDEQLGTMLRSANGIVGAPANLTYLAQQARRDLQQSHAATSHTPFRMYAIAAMLVMCGSIGALLYIRSGDHDAGSNREIVTTVESKREIKPAASENEPMDRQLPAASIPARTEPSVITNKPAAAPAATGMLRDSTKADDELKAVKTTGVGTGISGDADVKLAPGLAAAASKSMDSTAVKDSEAERSGEKDKISPISGVADISEPQEVAAVAKGEPESRRAAGVGLDDRKQSEDQPASPAPPSAPSTPALPSGGAAVQAPHQEALAFMKDNRAPAELVSPQQRLLSTAGSVASPLPPRSEQPHLQAGAALVAAKSVQSNGPQKLKVVAAADGVMKKPATRSAFTSPSSYSRASQMKQTLQVPSSAIAEPVLAKAQDATNQFGPAATGGQRYKLFTVEKERLGGSTTSALEIYQELAQQPPSAATAEAQLRLAELMYENPEKRAASAAEFRRCLEPAFITYYSDETIQDIRTKLVLLKKVTPAPQQ